MPYELKSFKIFLTSWSQFAKMWPHVGEFKRYFRRFTVFVNFSCRLLQILCLSFLLSVSCVVINIFFMCDNFCEIL